MGVVCRLFGLRDTGRTPFSALARAWDQGVARAWVRDSGLLGSASCGLFSCSFPLSLLFRGFLSLGETRLGATRPYCATPRGGGIPRTNLETYPGGGGAGGRG